VTRLDAGPPAVGDHSGGQRARAKAVPRERLGSGLAAAARRLVAWSSYIVLTAPAPEKLEAINWTGGELVTDFRTSCATSEPTRDGRSPSGAVEAGRSSRIDDSFTRDRRAVEELPEGFRRLFPSFCGCPSRRRLGRGPRRLANASSRPSGASSRATCTSPWLHRQRRGATHLAGKVIADLVRGPTPTPPGCRWSTPRRYVSPEPLRSSARLWCGARSFAKDTRGEGHQTESVNVGDRAHAAPNGLFARP